mgnify:CR=1 FL=1
MPKGISVQEAAQRLTEAGSRLSDRYTRGATGKGGKWQQGAAAAGQNYQQGVTEAIAQKRFEKGIAAATGAAYDAGVRDKGSINWPQGMALAGDKYVRKTQKFGSLWNQPLSTPRGARRSAANKTRMAENVTRFENAAKT